MQQVDLSFKGQGDLVYLGRNGIGKMEGAEIVTIGEQVIIYPINSKGRTARCYMEFPKAAIPALIGILQDTLKEAL
jgi:hypothetical protein